MSGTTAAGDGDRLPQGSASGPEREPQEKQLAADHALDHHLDLRAGKAMQHKPCTGYGALVI